MGVQGYLLYGIHMPLHQMHMKHDIMISARTAVARRYANGGGSAQPIRPLIFPMIEKETQHRRVSIQNVATLTWFVCDRAFERRAARCFDADIYKTTVCQICKDVLYGGKIFFRRYFSDLLYGIFYTGWMVHAYSDIDLTIRGEVQCL